MASAVGLSGLGGTILHSDNGGAIWVAQTSGTESDLISVSFAADGQRGWVAGDNGTILHSDNGGATWVAHTSEAQSWLRSVSFAADGQRGWVVGNSGRIFHSDNGGATWAAQTSGTQSELSSVSSAADGQHGWVVGTGGTILHSDNGGAIWVAQTSGTGSDLISVSFAANGQHGWAVGTGGTILRTKDSGRNWITVKLYHRSPAPAYFVLLAFSLAPLSFALGKPKEPRVGKGSIANAYIADRVLTAEEAEGTQVGAIAEGLASYLENPKTQAPLVIGVTGPWGSGKSSLMNLLRNALQARGFQTAWFNAWHNQSEEHLFASLLASLRGKALPPWWTPRGIRARERLLVERSGRMWLRLLLGLAGAVFILTVVVSNPTLHFDSNKLLEWSTPDKVL